MPKKAGSVYATRSAKDPQKNRGLDDFCPDFTIRDKDPSSDPKRALRNAFVEFTDGLTNTAAYLPK